MAHNKLQTISLNLYTMAIHLFDPIQGIYQVSYLFETTSKVNVVILTNIESSTFYTTTRRLVLFIWQFAN